MAKGQGRSKEQKHESIRKIRHKHVLLVLGSPLLAGPPMHISIPMVSKPLAMVWNAFAILRLGNFNTFCVFPPDSKAPNSHFSFQCVDLWRPAFSSHPRGSAWFSATILL